MERDDKAKVYKIPNEKLEIANPGPKGIIPHPSKLHNKLETGAK